MGVDFLRGRMTKFIDGLQDKLALGGDAVALPPELLRPIAAILVPLHDGTAC